MSPFLFMKLIRSCKHKDTLNVPEEKEKLKMSECQGCRLPSCDLKHLFFFCCLLTGEASTAKISSSLNLDVTFHTTLYFCSKVMLDANKNYRG